MPNMTNELSITRLERMLERRKSSLNSLVQTRNKLQKDLQKLEGRVGSLSAPMGPP